MKKSLADWLTHFENLHPVGIDMGLSRVARVWQNLCQAHNIGKLANEKVITVSGTNGKGSACKMLSLLLSAQGYRVGTYTSPHIHHFRERVTINSAEADDDKLTRAFAAIEEARGEISLSYFEATTLVGLLVFAWESVDFAVLEVGLGGRLDAINIIDTDAVLITSIGLDHEAFLGNDLAQIAVEKAGVCRPNAPCVYAETDVYDSVVKFTEKNRIPLIANGRDYQIDAAQVTFNKRQWRVPEAIAELGTHQISNCAGVLVLLATLGLLPDNYRAPLERFSLGGRLQRIGTRPDIVVDVAHNAASAHALANYLHRQRDKYDNIYAVIGMLRDKDHRATLATFDGIFDAVFCGTTTGERGLRDTVLADKVADVLACEVFSCDRLTAALTQATEQAHDNDLIIAFGSFLVIEALTTNKEISSS